MDRNTITGLVLIFILWMGLMFFTNKQKEAYEKAHPKTKKTAAIDSKKSNNSPVSNNLSDSTGASQTTNNFSDTAVLKANFGSFASFYNGKAEKIILENEDCKYVFNSKGGSLENIELKKFKTFYKKPLMVLEGNKNNFNLSFLVSNLDQPINTEQLYFTVKNSGKDFINFVIDLGEGKQIKRSYKIKPSGYMVDFEIGLENFDQMIPRNTSYISLNLEQKMPSQEHNVLDEQRISDIYYQLSNKEVDNLSTGKDKNEQLTTPISWVSLKQKFFNVTLIPKNEFERGTQISTARDVKKEYNMVAKAELVIPYSGSKSFVYPMEIYAGPNDYRILRKMDNGMENIVPLGWTIFGWVNRFLILPVFQLLGKFISSYGLIIFILTVLIKLITMPLTYKSTLSSIKMKVLKPELDELKAKFGKDAQKLQVAQMELYRKAGVNPMGGCLPMLIQMPILFAMYRFFPASIELRQQSFLWAQDLSSYDDFLSFGKANIPIVSTFLGNHISIFAILMAITSFISTKMTAQTAPSDDSPMAQQMKIMSTVMPFFLIFVFNKLAAAMTFYYFAFNVLTIVQTWFMKRFMIDEAKIHAQLQLNKTKPVKKSGWQEKMEKLMKEQQEQKRLKK
jgi:YidC/Oxa1 family membrane protein insertase